MDKVSIIVPIYQAEKYLGECLDSIIKQTYKNIEIILIEDGCSDKSGAICDEYAELDKRIIVCHNKNHGVSYSRNYGIKKAKGKYILFIDSDDSIDKYYVENFIDAITSYDCDIVVCGYEKIDIINNNKEKCLINKYDEIFSGLLKDDYYLVEPFLLTPWGKLYKTETIKENNIFFPEDCNIAEDQIFNYQYLRLVKRYLFINKPIYKYFYRNISSLTNNREIKNFFSEIKNLKIKKIFLRNIGVADTERIINENIIALIGLYLIKTTIKYGDFKRYILLLKKYIDFRYSTSKIKTKIIMKCLNKNCIFFVYVLFHLKKFFKK